MGWLKADEGAEEIESLDTVLLVHKEFVKSEEKDLHKSA